jgi:hypothetical protein
MNYEIVPQVKKEMVFKTNTLKRFTDTHSIGLDLGFIFKSLALAATFLARSNREEKEATTGNHRKKYIRRHRWK